MTTMGMKRGDAPRKALKRGGYLRKVSKKQAKRTRGLKNKLAVLLEMQDKIYGQTTCERQRFARVYQAGIPVEGCLRFDRLVFDHVNGRNEFNADRYENGQVLCWNCNSWKGSRRIDFRSPDMVMALKKLDEEQGK